VAAAAALGMGTLGVDDPDALDLESGLIPIEEILVHK